MCIRDRDHDLHLLPEQCQTKTTDRRKERICLCRLRIHLRRRCLAGWLYLSALQTWSGGFWADIVRRRSRRNSAPFLCLNILILFHNQMIVAIVIQSEIIADSFIYRCECIVVFFIFWRKRNHIWDKNIVVPLILEFSHKSALRDERRVIFAKEAVAKFYIFSGLL